jgi:hypothetical protein
MPWECFCFEFSFVLHVAPFRLQWPLAQLFPGARADSVGQCLACLSYMSMVLSH